MNNTKKDPDGKVKKGKVSKALDIVGIIVIVLLIPVLIINGTLVFKSFTNPDSPPDFRGYMPFVTGNDNLTEFDGDDLVIIKNMEENQRLEKGDIICYQHPKGVAIERIARVTDETGAIQYFTIVDTEDAESKVPVARSQIIGVYHKHVDDIGTFVLFMQTPMGILSCVVLPIAALLLAFYVVDRKKMKDALRKAQEAAAAAKANAVEEQ